MKFLSTILAALLTVTALAQTPPPVSLKGQTGTKLLPKWNLQVPYNQATNLGGIDALIETGNENLLSNPGFEAATFTQCSLYNDGDVAVPVDGSGGTATGLTLATQASTLGFGAKELKLTKDGSSRRGTGFSCDFTVPAGMGGSIFTHTSRYSTSANYADYLAATPGSDVGVYLYDVTNSTLIQPAVADVPANAKGQYLNAFQLSYNSTSFRLIYHIQTTNASAWDLIVDQFFGGSKSSTKGSPEIYLGELTTTGSWSTNTTYLGRYWRKGDRLLGEVRISTSGAPTAANLQVNLPSGLVLDTSKMDNSSNNMSVGIGNVNDSGSQYYNVRVRGDNTTGALRIGYLVQSTATYTNVSSTAPMSFGASDSVYIRYDVPIAGWSTNMALSEDGGTRDVIFYGYRSAALSQATGAQKVTLDATLYDTTSCFSSGGCLVNETGYYDIGCSVDWNNIADTGQAYCIIYVTPPGGAAAPVAYGSAYRNGAAGSTHSYGATVRQLAKGSLVELYAFQNDSATEALGVGVTTTFLTVAKRSSPQTIYPSGGAWLIANRAASQSIPNGVVTTLVFDTVIADSDAGYNASTGEWTVGKAGTYLYSCSYQYLTTGTWTVDEAMATYLQVNGSDTAENAYEFISTPASSVIAQSPQATQVGRLNRGDTVRCAAYQNSGAALNTSNNGYENRFMIVRIGD